MFFIMDKYLNYYVFVDEYKPCIVHRDVNSSNILVRADLSCCLSDLGLAMALPDSRKKTQQPKIQEVPIYINKKTF